MINCIFCQIIQRQIPASIVYEDEQVLAFHDIHPQAPKHILIIPKIHISTLNQLESEHGALMGKLILTARDLAHEFGIHDSGYRLILNCNYGAGQTVFHIHLHLLGGRRLGWPPG